MRPGFLPAGQQFFATIRDDEEVVLQEGGVSMRFDTSLQAVRYARAEIERRRIAALPPAEPPVVDPSLEVLSKWKREKAEALRLEREAFEMRTIKVETVKRRILAR